MSNYLTDADRNWARTLDRVESYFQEAYKLFLGAVKPISPISEKKS